MSQMICSGSGAANVSTKSHEPRSAAVGHELAGAVREPALSIAATVFGVNARLHEQPQLRVARVVEHDHRAEELEGLGRVLGQRDAAGRAEDVRRAG